MTRASRLSADCTLESTASISRDDIQVLSQEIASDIAFYRLLAGDRVRHITLPGDAFDGDTMVIPYLLIPALPPLPQGDWNCMDVERDGNRLKTVTSTKAMLGIRSVWHPDHIDSLTLPKDKVLKKCIYQTSYQGTVTIMKLANFEHDTPQIANETAAYAKIQTYQQSRPQEPPTTPKFLGHITEHGRVIGFLLEKVEGRHARIGDLELCKALVIQVHAAGLLHGDVNRYNFIINDEDPALSCIVDLEHSGPYDKTKALAELDSLVSELCEDTERGMPLP